MATRKFGKSKSRKRTVRRHKYSTAGKILPPLDVRSNKHLKDFEKRIKQGNLTVILVWAPWCPHCHTMMPHFDAATKSPNRSIQAVKVQDTMIPAVNEVLTRNINKEAKPINVEGYPSIIVVDKQGNKVTDIEPVRDTKTMTKFMENAGPLAEQAGINKPNQDPTSVANSIKNTLKSVKPLENIQPTSMNQNKKLLANLGLENEGLVQKEFKNSNLGEGELKGSVITKPLKNKNIRLNSIPVNQLGNSGQNRNLSKESISESVAPSPIKSFNSEESSEKTPSGTSSELKKMSQEAEEITSLEAPLTPPSGNEDIETESISNNLSPEQKISGGGRRGGSMMSAMARTTYTLAPAAALLATAAMVMKGKKNRTHKRSKTMRKNTRRRR